MATNPITKNKMLEDSAKLLMSHFLQYNGMATALWLRLGKESLIGQINCG